MNHNEELLHIFGYIDNKDSENTTPFFDFQGKAEPKSERQFNYYKSINEISMTKRMAQRKKHMQTPPREILINTPGEKPLLKMITHFHIMEEYTVIDKVTFDWYV